MDSRTIHLHLLLTVVNQQEDFVLNVAQPNKIPVEDFAHHVVNRITDRYVDNTHEMLKKNFCLSNIGYENNTDRYSPTLAEEILFIFERLNDRNNYYIQYPCIVFLNFYRQKTKKNR